MGRREDIASGPAAHGSAQHVRGRRTAPRWLVVAAAQVVVLAAAGTLVHVPLHSIAPGQTTNVLGEIRVRGAPTFASDGKLLLTTASVSHSPLTVWEALYVWLDPGISTVPRPFLVPPASSDAEQDLQNRHDIEASKIVAAVAAFRALGHSVPVVAGASVVTVMEGMPADGKLRRRDRILAVDGRAVDRPSDFSRRLARAEPGARVRLRIERRGERRTVGIETADVDGRPFVGVTLGPVYRFPSDVVIESGNVVGPSGGLVFALSIADAFTEDDLTRGHTIGVTGIIELGEDGRAIVRPIGAVKEKVRGAFRDGATVFIVPADEEEEARGVAPVEMRVIGVGTLEDAITALRQLPQVA